MTDLTAIAAARTAAEAVEADARALGEQLVAAKAELKRLHAELSVLPARVGDLQAAVTAAQASADAAAQARAQLSAQLAAAQARVSAGDAQAAAIQGQLEQAVLERDQLVQEEEDWESGGIDNRLVRPRLPIGGGRRPPNQAILRQIRAKEQQIASLQGSLATAEAGAAAARQQLGPIAAQVGAADAALQAARNDLSAVATQLAQAKAALDADTAALPAAEALPGQLRAQIADARGRVAGAWKPWSALLAAAHAELATAAQARDAASAQVSAAAVAAADARDAAADQALARAREALAQKSAALDASRAVLVAGDDADELVRLVAADAPLVLLPVRLETSFDPRADGGDLLVRIYPDTVHVSAHEPELTRDELAWGRHYLEQERTAAGDAEQARAAWVQLAGRFGRERAAWIAQAAGGEPPLRSDSWTRPPATAVLPDRWLALGYRAGARRFAVLGSPIADTLAVGPDPGGAPDPAAPLGAAAAWLLDFDRAVDAGMALRVPLDADDLQGLDRLVVVGVRASLDADASATRLSALLDAHHYSDGLALVPAGTPTNNTDAARAGWSSSDEGYARSWRNERVPSTSADADRLTRALGLGAEPLAHAGSADGAADVRAMATALWPATCGYALDQLLGGLSDAAIADARVHVLDHVQARGPLPTLRVGRQPYGVLPATSLRRFALLDPAGIDGELPPLLRALVPAWAAAAATVPRLTVDGAVEADLTGALAMSPLSVQYAARDLALHADDTFTLRQEALALPRALDLDVVPQLAAAGFELASTPLAGPAVTAEPSESDPLPDDANYVRWLAGAGWEALRSDEPPGGGDTLLFALLRHAVLREYAATALRIVRAHGLAQPGEGDEPGLGGSGPTPWERLQAPLDGVSGGNPLGLYLDVVRASGPAGPETVQLVELQAALEHLASLPSAALERLLAEALDVCSHRLDAWITGQADRRLEALRAQRPHGLRLGGYGVLYDVRPAPVRTLAEQVAQLQRALAAARATADAAAATRAQTAAQQASAQAQATTADGHAASLQDQLALLETQRDELVQEEEDWESGGGDFDPRFARPRLPVAGGGGPRPPNPTLLRRIREKEQQIAALRGPVADAQAAAAAADHSLAAVNAQLAVADTALQGAQATVARLGAQLAAAQAAEQDAVELAANKGFVHAPSLGQAATAAVLRSGHLAHRREDDTPFAVDLSSRRVRLALSLLDGVRQGQPLGALLGYRFERGLHENHPDLALDRHIATLRALAPLDDSTQAEAELRDALARQADLDARLTDLQRQLAAETAADQTRRASLQTALTGAQAQLAAARASASALAAELEQAQGTLQRLLDAAGDSDQRSHIPPWKLPNGDFPGAGISQLLQRQIHDATEAVRRLTAAHDTATAARVAAEAKVGDLTAQLGVADPLIDTLDQSITSLAPEVDAANAAVAAARAKVDAVRGQLQGDSADAVRANNVVDGLALRRRWRAGTRNARWDTSTIPFGDVGLPALATPEQQAIEAELRTLDDAVDAVGDLLTAESVHHLVHGNATRAAAGVDALSRGEAPPPEPEVVRTPGAGIGVSHRLLVLVAAQPAAVGWPTDATQLRARLEPGLEAWLAGLLGPAKRVRVRARYDSAGGHATSVADLSVLRLSALDVCATAVASAPAGATELELRLLDYFAHNRPKGVAADAAVALVVERDKAWGKNVLGLAELMEVARALRELLVGARGLDARDLAPPGETVDPGVDAADLAKRGALAAKALEDARAALAAAKDAKTLRAALLRASSAGVPGAVPASADAAGLQAQAAAVSRELDRRHAAAVAATDDAARIVAVLGPDWRVLPRVTAAPELGTAFAASAELQGDDPLASATWLERAAHVREGAGRLDGALIYAQALGSPALASLRVAQLPFRLGDRWAALPATPEQPIQGGRISLVAHGAGVPAGGGPVAGLVVDEWTEVVPAATQVTGIGFQFDQPNARAPQAILLAVPPTEDATWSLDALEAVVLETLDLADVRLADPEALARAGATTALPGAGHYLPAIYLASAPADATVTTDLSRLEARA